MVRVSKTLGGQRTLSLSQARRVGLAAQGLSRERNGKTITLRRIQAMLATVAQLQIDSINVVQRAHYMPLFSRLGSYDTDVLDRLVSEKHGTITEYWAHEASYVRSELIPDLAQWQRRRWVDRSASFTAEHHRLIDSVLSFLSDHPGTTARELSRSLNVAPLEEKTHWGWNWNETKYVTEALFAQAKILSLGRNKQFERRYALSADVLAAPSDDQPDSLAALRRLILRSLKSQGVATTHCIAEYFRLPMRAVRDEIEELCREGLIEKVSVQAVDEPCFMLPDTIIPRKVDRDLRILAPFDSMVFNRRRLETFFGFHYRIEVYVPEAKRQFGYYVFPILLGEEFIGRIDMKADRKASVLRVHSVHSETDDFAELQAKLPVELTRMASWLGLKNIDLNL